MWKWIGRILLALFGLGVLSIVVLIKVRSEPQPLIHPSADADALAEAMLKAIHKTAWDSTTFVSWTFSDRHEYLWDKRRDFVQVIWKDHRVLLNTKQIKGEAWKGKVKLSEQRATKMVQRAWQYYCNDAFWLNAPSKVFDPGTVRSIVTTKDGRKGLAVHYAAGGVTPGDTYVWILDNNHRPIAWKMWVKILPIGGLEASWDGWVTTTTGACLATRHTIMSLKQPTITNLKCGNDLSEVGYAEDPFLTLQQE